MADYGHLLVTTDFSEGALPGIEEAARLARRLESEITLLYVVEDRLPALVVVASNLDRGELLDRHRIRAEETLIEYAHEHLPGVPVKTVVRVGRAVETILDVARDIGADLIVMASHGHGAVRHALFGSTTERVLHHAPCPVLVVHSPEA